MHLYYYFNTIIIYVTSNGQLLKIKTYTHLDNNSQIALYPSSSSTFIKNEK